MKYGTSATDELDPITCLDSIDIYEIIDSIEDHLVVFSDFFDLASLTEIGIESLEMLDRARCQDTREIV
jgi:hypothetical protein